MEMNKIEVGGVYWDGRLGVRKVLEIEKMPPGVMIPDAGVRYEVLFARAMTAAAFDVKTNEGNPGGRMILSSLASWSKEKVAPEDVEPLLARLKAERFRPSPAQAALVLRLQEVQGESNQVVPLLPRETTPKGALVAAGFLISPSGTKFARLSLAGRALAQRLSPAQTPSEPAPEPAAVAPKSRGPRP